MNSVQRRCTNLVHLRSDTSVHEICTIRAFDRWQSLFYIKYFVQFNIFDLNLVFRRYLPGNDYLSYLFLTVLSVFLCDLSEFMAVDNFN